jgi:hypothetical protein
MFPCFQPSAISYQLSAIRHPPSAISHALSAISYPLLTQSNVRENRIRNPVRYGICLRNNRRFFTPNAQLTGDPANRLRTGLLPTTVFW